MARRRSRAQRGAGIRITIGAISALVLIGVAAVFVFTRDDGGVSAGDDVAAAGVRAGAGPAAATGAFFKRVGDSWKATERIEALEKENRDLRQWRETSLALSERLERYEALLKMPREAFGVGALADRTISARLILDAGGPFKRTLLANAGADHGVERGYIALNEHGLIGRVVAVGKRSSRVLILDDFNSKIPVMGLQSRARAMLAGDASASPRMETGAAVLSSPRLEYQAPAGVLREGERIVTSGDGGVFPRGLLVGFAHRDDQGVWRARLATSAHPIDYVRLMPFAPIEAPESTLVNDPGPPTPVVASSAVTAVALPPAGLVAPPKTRIRPLAPVTLAPDEIDEAPPVPDSTPAPPPVTPGPQ